MFPHGEGKDQDGLVRMLNQEILVKLEKARCRVEQYLVAKKFKMVSLDGGQVMRS